MKKLLAYLNSKEFQDMFKAQRHTYTTGMDIADSIALAIICILLVLVVFI
jgi:hypothetical protein